MASISEATYKQYGKPIRLWWTFAQQISSDWFAPDISRVLDFLAALSESIASYGTLNSYRSAISLVTNVNLGSDERIKRFCKGMSVIKPSKPKYALTWDPAPVQTYLSSLSPHESLRGYSSLELQILGVFLKFYKKKLKIFLWSIFFMRYLLIF